MRPARRESLVVPAPRVAFRPSHPFGEQLAIQAVREGTAKLEAIKQWPVTQQSYSRSPGLGQLLLAAFRHWRGGAGRSVAPAPSWWRAGHRRFHLGWRHRLVEVLMPTRAMPRFGAACPVVLKGLKGAAVEGCENSTCTARCRQATGAKTIGVLRVGGWRDWRQAGEAQKRLQRTGAQLGSRWWESSTLTA